MVRFLAKEVSRDSYLNIMAQYYPCYKAFDIPALARPLLGEELAEAINMALQQGLHRLDSRESPLKPVLR